MISIEPFLWTLLTPRKAIQTRRNAVLIFRCFQLIGPPPGSGTFFPRAHCPAYLDLNNHFQKMTTNTHVRGMYYHSFKLGQLK